MDVPAVRPFSLQTEGKDGATVIHLKGELDLAGVSKLQEALHSAQHADTSQIVVDFRGLTFLDSTGLGALIAADNAGRDGHVCSLIRTGQRDCASRVPAHLGRRASELGRRARLAHRVTSPLVE